MCWAVPMSGAQMVGAQPLYSRQSCRPPDLSWCPSSLTKAPAPRKALLPGCYSLADPNAQWLRDSSSVPWLTRPTPPAHVPASASEITASPQCLGVLSLSRALSHLYGFVQDALLARHAFPTIYCSFSLLSTHSCPFLRFSSNITSTRKFS